MSPPKGYGAVYTPEALSDFVAKQLLKEYYSSTSKIDHITIADPACGESSLLNAISDNICSLKINYTLIGTDIDYEAIKNNKIRSNNDKHFFFDCIDSIIADVGTNYWCDKKIDMVIANPPWSSDRVYDKNELNNAGYTLIDGQYDSFVLFIELALNIVRENGFCAFILPDSLFAGENINVRQLLCKNTQIRLIARLGEKIFPSINRATSVIIVQKKKPTKETNTTCFRLDTKQRREFLTNKITLSDAFLNSSHIVSQSRFCRNINYLFDVDAKQDDEYLLHKLESDRIDWTELFEYSRGVEISKYGRIVTCPICGQTQSYSNNQQSKLCTRCKKSIDIEKATKDTIVSDEMIDGFEKIFVGENVQRYEIIGNKYIKCKVDGIKYKDYFMYSPQKILIRKTGLGIKATIDETDTYVNQTVHICKLKNNSDEELYYYLGLLNSRAMYYYYLKKYGETEWKSHPYLTKTIIFNLPLKKYSSTKICKSISKISKEISIKYNRKKDLELESKIEELYSITISETEIVRECLNSLPDLSSINDMKY